MIREFERMEKYISLLSEKDLDHLVFPKSETRDGVKINLMTHVDYSEMETLFLEDFYKFRDANIDEIYKDNNYFKVLEEYRTSSGVERLSKLDFSLYDARCVGAILLFSIRADRFCEGALKADIESGLIVKCLRRLKDIVQTESSLGTTERE